MNPSGLIIGQPNTYPPLAKAFAASMTFDLGLARNYEVGKITSDFGIVLANGADGFEFSIALSQATGGGKLITSVTASGRTVLMRADLTQLNTTPFLVADANSVFWGRYDTINGVAVVIVDIHTGAPLVLGNESFAFRVNALFGAAQVATWDGALGITPVSGGADAWVDQKGGVSLPATTLGSGPVYSASDVNFNGRPSVTGASGKGFRKTGLSAFLANGSKPYWWGVARMPTLITGGVQCVLFDCGVAAVSDDFKLQSVGTATTSDWTFTQAGHAAAYTGVGTSAVLIEVWVDAAGTNHLAINGVDVATSGSGTAIGHDISVIGVFVAASSAVQPGAFALAAHGFMAAAPASPLRAGLHALAQAYYAVG